MSNDDQTILSEWRPIRGYEKYYEINTQGKIRSRKAFLHGKEIKQRIGRGGYLTVRLYTSEKGSATKYVHRLLGTTFIPNPAGKCCINHLNGNKLDNSISNLAWVTHSENVKHAYDRKLIRSKSKKVIDKCSGFILDSAKVAADLLGIPYHTMRQYLNGGIKYNPTCMEYL